MPCRIPETVQGDKPSKELAGIPEGLSSIPKTEITKQNK